MSGFREFQSALSATHCAWPTTSASGDSRSRSGDAKRFSWPHVALDDDGTRWWTIVTIAYFGISSPSLAAFSMSRNVKRTSGCASVKRENNFQLHIKIKLKLAV